MVFILDDDDDFKHRAWLRRRPAVLFALIIIIAIGGTAFSAWQAETALAETEHQLYDYDKTPPALTAARKLEAVLGYEGFLGTLNSFHRGPSLDTLKKLRNEIEEADQALLTMASSAPMKFDLPLPAMQNAVLLYKQALDQADKVLVGETTVDPNAAARLDDVYNSIFAFTARIERAYQGQTLALLRQQQQEQSNLLWLTIFISLGLVIGLSALARGAYTHPLQKLLASLRAKEAMDRTLPLWGTTRSDTIGDLSRALEALRQKLLNTPDILVMKGDDATPLRFGGHGGAIFQALVDELSSAVANIRAAELPTTLAAVEQLNKSIASSASAIYQDIKASADAIQGVGASLMMAEQKTSAAAEAITDRAQTMGEIAQLTGMQAQTSLRELLHAQGQIKNTAAAGDAVIRGFATKASDLSERLVAATNLMRAGGKVLQETVEGLRGRVTEAAQALAQSDSRIDAFLSSSETRLASLASKAEEAFAGANELAVAGARITSTASKLELSEGDLNRAVTAMLSQSEQFMPLSNQLRDLHEQLATHVTKHANASDDAISRLVLQTDRLKQLNSELDGPLATAQQRLEKLGELADSLAGVLSHINDLPSKLSTLTQLQEDTLTGLGQSLEKNTAATEMNALRMDASLRLVSDQLTDLLQKLNSEQTSLLDQLAQLRTMLSGNNTGAITQDHIEGVERALSARIEEHYQQFTTELTALLQKFEQAVAKPVIEEASQPSTMEAMILQRLRDENVLPPSAAPAAEPSMLNESTGNDVSTALSRLSQIKKLTSTLTEQTHSLKTDDNNPETLGERAKELIGEVMGAISDLTQLASDISDISQQHNKESQ